MASLKGNVGVEVELKSTSLKFWEGILKSNELFPKIFPKQYKSIQLIEGDANGVGSIRKINFGEDVPIITTVTERVNSIDEANKKLSYSSIEGDLLSLYKTFNATLQLLPNGEGCIAKWTLSYEKVDVEVPDPKLTIELAEKTFQDFDAYLLQN